MQIRESIAVARTHEVQKKTLEKYLAAKLPNLHRHILLQENDAECLTAFVTEYIEHVPSMLDALRDLTKTIGIYSDVENIVNIIDAFFALPLNQDEYPYGLYELIDEAYFAHRIIEEINDQVISKVGTPLVPLDVMLSNVVVHDILGDEFANTLERVVTYSVESLFDVNALINNENFKNFASRYHQSLSDGIKWPCLAKSSSISLNKDDSDSNNPIIH